MQVFIIVNIYILSSVQYTVHLNIVSGAYFSFQSLFGKKKCFKNPRRTSKCACVTMFKCCG